MFVELLIVGGLLTATGIIATRKQRQKKRAHRRQQEAEARRPAVERTPWSLRKGDIVSYAAKDYVVEKTLTFEEEGPRFREFVLMGDEDARLHVLPQGEVSFLLPASPPDNATSLPDRIDFSGRQHRLLRRGSVLLAGERWQYADYEAPPGRLLMIRIPPSGEVEAYAGEKIAARGLLELLPGS